MQSEIFQAFICYNFDEYCEKVFKKINKKSWFVSTQRVKHGQTQTLG